MRLDRFFYDPKHLHRWTENVLDADKLLDLLAISAKADDDRPFQGMSVYSASCEAELNENAAVWYATNKTSKVKRVFALRLDPVDLQNAGVSYVVNEDTGPKFTPAKKRHLELSGTRGQFVELVKATLRRLNQNEEVICVVPRERVTIQLENLALAGEAELSKTLKASILQKLGRESCGQVRQACDPENATIRIDDTEDRVHEIVVAREVGSVAEQAVSTDCRCVCSRGADFFRRFRCRKD